MSISPFTMSAPVAQRYADFAPPDPLNFSKSPDYQYVLDAQQKALEHSAAARGSYFTPNTMFSLQGNAAGLASGEYDKAYGRALSTYGTNRDTAHQYFGDELAGFNGELAKFGANAGATTANNNFSLAASDRATEASNTAYDRSAYENAQRQAQAQAIANPPATQWVDPYAAQNAAESARVAGPSMSLAHPVTAGSSAWQGVAFR